MVDGGDQVIETVGLTKRYPRVVAVDEVSLSIGAGEIVGLLGPNGAGKSTLLRLLLDLARPTSGSVRVLGMDPRQFAPEIHRRLGFVPAEPALPSDLTGAGYLDFVTRLAGHQSSSRRQELAERLDIDMHRPLRELSTGNYQKVALVAALSHTPELIVLDEPTRGLDPIVQREFNGLLAEERRRGATVLLSSHSLSVVEQVVDRVCILRNGSLVADDRLDRLKAAAVRRVEFELAHTIDAAACAGLPGVHDVTIDDCRLEALVQGPVDPLLRAVLALTGVVSVRSAGDDLEDVFLNFYRPTDVPAPIGAER